MLRTWTMKNTFISKLLPYSYNYLNNNYISKTTFEQKQNTNFNLFKIDKQISTTFHDNFNLSNFKINVNITEQDHLYPKPYSLISNNFIYSTLHISSKNTNIIEMYNIKFNFPDDFNATIHYLLLINNDTVKKVAFTGLDNKYFSNGLKQTRHTDDILSLF
jgi:hypothetical protein